MSGMFRKDIYPTDLHMSISALCFSYVSNKYTFGSIFDVNMSSAESIAKRKKSIVNTILSSVKLQDNRQ